MSATKTFTSETQPNLNFTVEHDADVNCWIIFAQVKGYPKTEACDDWFNNEADASRVAEKLAKGDL